MNTLWEAIREFLARLFGASTRQRRLKALDAMEDKLLAAKRDNTDNLQDLKQEIRTLEARALQKKKELDQTRGDSRRIVVGEIERTFRDLDRLRDRETLIAANLDRISIALAKVREAKAALAAGITEEQFDEIALEVQDLFTELRETDRAARDLEREKYEAPEKTPVQLEERMAEVAGEKEPPAELSPETQKRLQELATEEET